VHAKTPASIPSTPAAVTVGTPHCPGKEIIKLCQKKILHILKAVKADRLLLFLKTKLEHARNPPAAETHHTTTKNNKIRTNRKETREERNTTKNSHQTNTQEDTNRHHWTETRPSKPTEHESYTLK
jgi:hypothetical protein